MRKDAGALFCTVSPSSLNTSTECEQQWTAAGTGAPCETQPMFAPKHWYLQHSPVPVLLQVCIIHEKPLGDAGDAVTASGPRSRQRAQSSNKWLVWKHLTMPRVRTPECWWYTEERCIETEREKRYLCCALANTKAQLTRKKTVQQGKQKMGNFSPPKYSCIGESSVPHTPLLFPGDSRRVTNRLPCNIWSLIISLT